MRNAFVWSNKNWNNVKEKLDAFVLSSSGCSYTREILYPIQNMSTSRMYLNFDLDFQSISRNGLFFWCGARDTFCARLTFWKVSIPRNVFNKVNLHRKNNANENSLKRIINRRSIN